MSKYDYHTNDRTPADLMDGNRRASEYVERKQMEADVRRVALWETVILPIASVSAFLVLVTYLVWQLFY